MKSRVRLCKYIYIYICVCVCVCLLMKKGKYGDGLEHLDHKDGSEYFKIINSKEQGL